MDFKIRPKTKTRSPQLFVVVFEYRNKKKEEDKNKETFGKVREETLIEPGRGSQTRSIYVGLQSRRNQKNMKMNDQIR